MKCWRFTLANYLARIGLHLANYAAQLSLVAMEKEFHLPKHSVNKAGKTETKSPVFTEKPRYTPTDKEEQAAMIVAQYGVALVLEHDQACAIAQQKGGSC